VAVRPAALLAAVLPALLLAAAAPSAEEPKKHVDVGSATLEVVEGDEGYELRHGGRKLVGEYRIEVGR
jgi:hypothetical protein